MASLLPPPVPDPVPDPGPGADPGAAASHRKRPNRRGAATRERLLLAAGQCFAEQGYSRTRVSDIAARAGMAQGGFYRHFEGLEEIFLAVLRPALAELAAASRRRGDDDARQATSAAALIEVSTAYLRSYATHRAELRLLREAAAADDGTRFRPLWLDMRGDFVGRTRLWLSRLHDAGLLAPLDDVGLDLLAETIGCLTEQLAYVHLGLPEADPGPARVAELGVVLGTSWHRMLPLLDPSPGGTP